ncbi:acetylglutamate kinase [Candidatus Peregrinibacteria bacterium]|nr:acetylglutamate kinase [Candidatus Peregrinibacteria bacterium]
MSYSKKKHYLAKFQNKIFVLKIGGEVVAEKNALESILKDIKKLTEAGIKIILVHGGGKQADLLAAQIGHTPVKINGRRVTSQQDLEIAKMLYGGSLNVEILSLMKKLNMKGIRISGLDGNFLEVHIRDTKEFDFGYVGDVDAVNPQVLFDVLAKGYIPVVSPLASDNDGIILNINADTIAAEIAITLKTEKLIIFTSARGVYHGKKLLSVITAEQAFEMISHSIAKDGMAVKLNNAIAALQGGVKRVHIVNGLSKHSLLVEVLTKKGIGTMITSEKEKQFYLKKL